MGYFTLKLPDYKKADVRFGPVKKMKTLSHRFRRKNLEEEQIAYIVKVDTGFLNERVYYILKTKEGEWLNDIQDGTTAVIKNAIDKYEHQLCGAKPWSA